MEKIKVFSLNYPLINSKLYVKNDYPMKLGLPNDKWPIEFNREISTLRILESHNLLQHYIYESIISKKLFIYSTDNYCTIILNKYIIEEKKILSDYFSLLLNYYETLFMIFDNNKICGFECHNLKVDAQRDFEILYNSKKLDPLITRLYDKAISMKDCGINNEGIFYKILNNDATPEFVSNSIFSHALNLLKEYNGLVGMLFVGWPLEELEKEKWFIELNSQNKHIIIYGSELNGNFISKCIYIGNE